MASASFGDRCRGEFHDLCVQRAALKTEPATHKRRAFLLHEIDLVLDQYLAWREFGEVDVSLFE